MNVYLAFLIDFTYTDKFLTNIFKLFFLFAYKYCVLTSLWFCYEQFQSILGQWYRVHTCFERCELEPLQYA